MTTVRPTHRRRVIVNTDAKNEADDQFAIVHALLSPSLDIRGVIPAHFGHRPRRSMQSLADSRGEVDLLLKYMRMLDTVRVADGATHALPDYRTPMPSAGADLIIEEATRADVDGPLYVLFFGPLTDMASALLLDPSIAERDVVVVWIGGGPYEEGATTRLEFNLSNDVTAANVVFASGVSVWQIPMSTYRLTAVGYAELDEKVAPCGELGEYLVRQLKEWNAANVAGPIEFRPLGDSPAVGVVLDPDSGRFTERPAPQFRYDGSYDHSRPGSPIRVYETFDSRFLFEDMFAKLRQFARIV